MISYGTWSCPECGLVVSEDMFPCPNCHHHQILLPAPIQKYQPNQCNVCTYTNTQFANHCKMCQAELPDKPLQLSLVINKYVVTCKSCKQENDLTNQVCAFCEEQLYQSQKIKCSICYQHVKKILYSQHHIGCLLSHELIKKEQEQILEKQKQKLIQKNKNLEECIHCRQKFDSAKLKKHEPNCNQKQLVDLQMYQKTRMSKLQLQAINYMNKKAQKQHNEVKGALQLRIKKLGFSIEDLNNLQFYIQNYAPIIIHIHVSKHMQFFIKDTHYRSQFETNKSSGSLSRPNRIVWEDRMFDKKYTHAKDVERVKYGVINFTNDPKGVGVCVAYGVSYFLLKEHVRERCTFTDKDSSAVDSSIATFKYCFKILSKMSDEQLKAAIDASKAKEVSSKCTAAYKQMQIHGPIEFNKDIQTIYVNKNEVKGNKALLDMVYEFSKKNNVEHDFF